MSLVKIGCLVYQSHRASIHQTRNKAPMSLGRGIRVMLLRVARDGYVAGGRFTGPTVLLQFQCASFLPRSMPSTSLEVLYIQGKSSFPFFLGSTVGLSGPVLWVPLRTSSWKEVAWAPGWAYLSRAWEPLLMNIVLELLGIKPLSVCASPDPLGAKIHSLYFHA